MKKGRPKTREYFGRDKYLAKYKIDEWVYREMLEEQNHRCGICGIHQEHLDKPLCVDHDHETNKVRGLLCNNCNTGLGFFKDNPRFLAHALVYLERNGKEY